MQTAPTAGKFWQPSHGGKTLGCHNDKRRKVRGDIKGQTTGYFWQSNTHVHPKDIARLHCCFEIVPAF